MRKRSRPYLQLRRIVQRNTTMIAMKEIALTLTNAFPLVILTYAMHLPSREYPDYEEHSLPIGTVIL